MHKDIKLVLKATLIVFVMTLVIIFISNLLFAYFSYASACKPDNIERINNNTNINLQTVGTTSVNKETSEPEVTFARQPSLEDIKHELIHVHQIQRGFVFSCSNSIGRILMELEAYTFEDIPTFLFEKLYGFDLKINNNI